MASIKINGDTSGSITLAAPDSGSDVSLTLPTTALATEAYVNALSTGKILQVVRTTNTSEVNTNSTTYVDISGSSVTITPTSSANAIIVLATGWSYAYSSTDGQNFHQLRITDSGANPISGAQRVAIGVENLTGSSTRAAYNQIILIGYATPATTSAVTYKLQHNVPNANTTGRFWGSLQTGQMYAIEVAS